MSDDHSLNHGGVQEDQLDGLDELLARQEYPATTREIVEAHGDYQVQSRRGWTTVGEVFAPVDDETFESPQEVQDRLLRLLNRQ